MSHLPVRRGISGDIVRALRHLLRGGFFVSRLLGVVYAAGSKNNKSKKHTEHERVQFLDTTDHERGRSEISGS